MEQSYPVHDRMRLPSRTTTCNDNAFVVIVGGTSIVDD
jgi:hypothetical protein